MGVNIFATTGLFFASTAFLSLFLEAKRTDDNNMAVFKYFLFDESDNILFFGTELYFTSSYNIVIFDQYIKNIRTSPDNVT